MATPKSKLPPEALLNWREQTAFLSAADIAVIMQWSYTAAIKTARTIGGILPANSRNGVRVETKAFAAWLDEQSKAAPREMSAPKTTRPYHKRKAVVSLEDMLIP